MCSIDDVDNRFVHPTVLLTPCPYQAVQRAALVNVKVFICHRSIGSGCSFY